MSNFKKGSRVRALGDDVGIANEGDLGTVERNTSDNGVVTVELDKGETAYLHPFEVELIDEELNDAAVDTDAFGDKDKSRLYHFHHPEVHKKLGSVSVCVGPVTEAGARPMYIARCSSKDNFNKKIGKAMATGRLEKPTIYPWQYMVGEFANGAYFALSEGLQNPAARIVKAVIRAKLVDEALLAKLM